MGASFSLLRVGIRHLLRHVIRPRGQPASAVTAAIVPEEPHYSGSERPGSPTTNSSHGEATELTSQSPLSNDESELIVHSDKPTHTGTMDQKPPDTPSGDGRPRPPELFALIIGIDDYSNCPKLRGAVTDAKAVKQFLETVYQVPEDHILTLYDRNATRDAIIKAFKNLCNDKRIQSGDPILIFYAGHGGELAAPPPWGVEGKIQCLLPQDFKPPSISPIPDRTVGTLIGDIAQEKGDNITVIFDCCHSASGTRDKDEAYVPRTVELDMQILPTLDDYIWGTRAGTVSKGFAYHGLQSHVLLAACGEKELAYEHEGSGQFTNALLAALKSGGVTDLTYSQLLERIHLSKQNPHCEGVNRHRVLFNEKVLVGRHVYHSAQAHEGGKYVINAGLAHGVSHGVEFTLYNDRNVKLGVVEVDGAAAIGDFTTTLIPSAHLTNISFAKLTRIGKLPLYLGRDGNLSAVLEEAPRQVDGTPPNFRPANNAEAKMEVAMEKDQIVFNILDQRVNRFGLTKLPYEATRNNITDVVDAAAHFYWYLDLTKGHDSNSPRHDVAVEFYYLKREYDDYGLPFLLPREPGFCRKDPNADNSDIIDFVVDEKALYGIKISNNTSWDLYLNALLFNISSLSIAPYYTQPSAGNPAAPLKQGGTFTIGYGPGGTPPFSYSLEDGQDVDVGFLKIFFSTRPVDLSDIVQPSPFTVTDETGKRGEGEEEARKVRFSSLPTSAAKPAEPEHTWFTLDIPVVQRRK